MKTDTSIILSILHNYVSASKKSRMDSMWLITLILKFFVLHLPCFACNPSYSVCTYRLGHSDGSQGPGRKPEDAPSILIYISSASAIHGFLESCIFLSHSFHFPEYHQASILLDPINDSKWMQGFILIIFDLRGWTSLNSSDVDPFTGNVLFAVVGLVSKVCYLKRLHCKNHPSNQVFSMFFFFEIDILSKGRFYFNYLSSFEKLCEKISAIICQCSVRKKLLCRIYMYTHRPLY